jgi:RimJ/RimL family protein N-acetyltransferase
MRSPLLVGERVYLRPVEAGDAELLARIDATETDTFMWRSRVPTSPMEYDNWIAELYKQQPPQHVFFSVCLRDGDRFIGNVGVVDIDWLNRTGETASFLGPAELRGKGYGTEAKHLLLEYCFDRIHLHVVKSEVDGPNTRSAAALAKQGYQPAGRLRWTDVKGGRYIDTLLFDVTREEWLAARDARDPTSVVPGFAEP